MSSVEYDKSEVESETVTSSINDSNWIEKNVCEFILTTVTVFFFDYKTTVSKTIKNALWFYNVLIYFL